jgi:hypothetical protein
VSGPIEIVESLSIAISSSPQPPSEPSWWLLVLRWLADKVLPPALLALAVSWAIPRSIERWKGKRDHFHKTVETLRAQLQLLQATSSSYWTSRYNGTLSPQQEEAIQFLLGDITKLVRIAALAGAPGLYESEKSEGVKALAQLVDAATGGNFGSPKRVADPGRSRAVTRASLHLLSLIADARWGFVSGDKRSKP